jgi:glycosyltransferase involved in cell wall biosynthesis
MKLPELPTEEEIVSNWQTHETSPRCVETSICCITFNHERFVELAINGFLTQRTTKPFEVLVHDDASTDSTQSILKAYQSRYPKLIKLKLQSVNQYKKGFRPLENYLLREATGRFIAICEGDDFWTNRDKLEKQLAVLSDPAIAGVFHRVQIQDENLNKLPQYYIYPENGILDSNTIIFSTYFATCSMLFRKSAITPLTARSSTPLEILGSDRLIANVVAMHGKWVGLDECLGVHIKHSGGITASPTYRDQRQRLESTVTLCETLVDIASDLDREQRAYLIKGVRNLIRLLANDLACARLAQAGHTIPRLIKLSWKLLHIR